VLIAQRGQPFAQAVESLRIFLLEFPLVHHPSNFLAPPKVYD
jgi:hypothetical protein